MIISFQQQFITKENSYRCPKVLGFHPDHHNNNLKKYPKIKAKVPTLNYK